MMCRADLQVQQLSETAAVVANRPIRVNPQRLISGAPAIGYFNLYIIYYNKCRGSRSILRFLILIM